MSVISLGRRPLARIVSGVLLAIAVTACGGGQDAPDEAATGGESAATTGASPVPPAGGTSADQGNPQLVALGDSIFHGLAAGGTCVSCHGPQGSGGATAPSLADAEWLHGDGSLDAIVNVVSTGVPAPKQFPAPMPPMGGASLSTEQVRAVALYVRSLAGGPR